MKKITFLFAILVISIPCAAATLTVPTPYSTIQSAINAAVSGADTVEVAEGTYYENINFNGKNIVLTSIDPTDPNVVAATIIDGNASGSVVTFSGTETSACQLTGFTIRNGNTTGSGGGIYGGGTNATILNCVITGNYAGDNGGGLLNCHGPITNCTITGNTALDYHGGGLYNCDGAITNCTISGNIANQNGGGLYHCTGSITNCTIFGNIASGWNDLGGGLVFCNGSITNCTISGNSANQGGGLAWCDGPITNCTIVSNSSSYYGGGGMYHCNGSITNCIIWKNTASHLSDQLRSSSVPKYSCIQGWTEGDLGNISDDPLFVDPSGGNYHIQPGSPCTDAGTNSPSGGLPSTDLDGNPRPIDGDNDSNAIADMGAYENLRYIEPVIVLSAYNFNFFGFEEGSNPYDQILEIRNWGENELHWSITESCDWLRVTPGSGSSTGEPNEVTLSIDIAGLTDGLYTCDLTVSDPCAINDPQTVNVNLGIGALYVPAQFSTIQSAIDAASHGDLIIVAPGIYYELINFNGKNIVLTSTDPSKLNVIANTIINGDGSGHVVEFSGSETSACELTGFTITNGHARGPWPHYFGGGIYGDNTSATISNCIITNNTANDCGGGLYSCAGVIRNCTIIGNTSYEDGGGLYNCDGIISNCVISYNLALGDAFNETGYGGGLDYCNGLITNCIIWANTAGNSGDQLYSGSAPTYSCIQDWGGGGSNISDNPLFFDAAADDYHLKSEAGRWDPYNYMDPNSTPSDPNDDFWVTIPGQWVTDDVTSPCIDTGDPCSLVGEELWPDGGRINMGAYGGTAQASMSLNTAVGNPADFNKDDFVDYEDFSWFFDSWQREEILLAEDINRNNFVDMVDVALFAQEWLWEQ